ncbi:MAG: EF-P lysine aminoacylase EpmA [Myxococcota bacterium]|nr:EF-P lysine aminoacylase EpmA [Myxococcota bacterium]
MAGEMTPKSDIDLALEERRRLQGLKHRLNKRAHIIQSVRSTLTTAGFLEVETPIRVRAPAPEQHIDAIPTGRRFLITSPELHLKRLIAAGYEKIFEICHCFRNGERGTTHLPEFTMVEWYRVRATQADLMTDCEHLIAAAATSVGAFPIIERGQNKVDLTPPWERIDVSDAFERLAGWRPGANPDPDRFDTDLVAKVESGLPLDRPVFLCGYPAAMAALARLDPADPARAERFELYAGGLELANGFTELVDFSEQRCRFEAEARTRAEAGKTVYPFDTRFLGALELGIDACAGIALGLDRLIMLLTGAATIDEVVAFPEGAD